MTDPAEMGMQSFQEKTGKHNVYFSKNGYVRVNLYLWCMCVWVCVCKCVHVYTCVYEHVCVCSVLVQCECIFVCKAEKWGMKLEIWSQTKESPMWAWPTEQEVQSVAFEVIGANIQSRKGTSMSALQKRRVALAFLASWKKERAESETRGRRWQWWAGWKDSTQAWDERTATEGVTESSFQMAGY